MKRKLITAGIFLALAIAMGLAVYFNIPRDNSLVAHSSVTSTPRGTLAMPASGTDSKFSVTVDLPKTNAPATAPPSK